MGEATTRFKNTSGGNVGVVKVKRNGDAFGAVVEPHGEVELTAEEQQLTADAPRDPAKSPFQPHPYADTDESGNVVDQGERPLLEEITARRPIPAEPPVGQRDEREVVGA